MESTEKQLSTNEVVRLTIAVGIVATAISLITLGPNTDTSALIGLIKAMAILLVITSFSYIMLTGILLKYIENEDRALPIHALQWLRKHSYNISINLYWGAFLWVIYLLISSIFGLSMNESQDLALKVVFLSLAAVLIFAIVAVSVVKVRKKSPKADNHETTA